MTNQASRAQVDYVLIDREFDSQHVLQNKKVARKPI